MANRRSNGRAALVTGGSSGIGLAIARVLGEEGYAITLSAHVKEEVDSAAASLRRQGVEVQGVVADMAEERDAIALVAAHREAYGRLDVLINNAGIGLVGPVEKIQTPALDRLLAVNLRGAMIAIRETLPLLRAAGAEHRKALISNTASISGKSGLAGLSVYGAAKAAIIAFTQSAQREAGDEGIQCTALAPGVVDTAMTAPLMPNAPSETMIQPADIAEAVRFLLRTSPNCHVPEIVFTRSG